MNHFQNYSDCKQSLGCLFIVLSCVEYKVMLMSMIVITFILPNMSVCVCVRVHYDDVDHCVNLLFCLQTLCGTEPFLCAYV